MCKPQQLLPSSAVVYFDGAAYVLGSATAYRNFVGQVAARAQAAIFVVDYSLAPERIFPAAVDDAKAVYLGLAASGFPWLVIAGDSAGGGLALALLLRTTTGAQRQSLQKALAAVAIRAFLTWSYEGVTADPASSAEASIQEALLSFSGMEGVLGALGVHRAAFTI